MTKSEFIQRLKASLHDAASVFDAPADADFERHLSQALLCFSSPLHRPLRKRGTVTLVAGTQEYDPPDDFASLAWVEYGAKSRREFKPWERQYMNPPFQLHVLRGETGRKLRAVQEVTESMISTHGAECAFFYNAVHVLTDSESTVPSADEGLLLLRAQAEAMKEMSVRNILKPVTIQTGIAGALSNGTPGGLCEMMMRYYEGRF